ncbi:hypothetical protein [Paenibacillus nasutitermitis]|uniref:hypothetical protein n=1 Tax=Paenibacillus nasutitermitis TaxID=1652958 RepID=UPI001E64BED6|nr:hypothetical protein [Paenibacillus nasutitermitis]
MKKDVKNTNVVKSHSSYLWLRKWPSWIAYAAAAWSLLYGIMAVYWTLTGVGYPFGEGDPHHYNSFLGNLQAKPGSLSLAVWGFLGAVIGAMIARKFNRKWLLWGPLVYAWANFVFLLIVIPDSRAITAFAYIPIVIVGAPFGWPPVNFIETALPWPVLNQFLCMVGGFLWLGTAISYLRLIRGSCLSCGCSHTETSDHGWKSRNTAARWGKWATYTAFILPFAYSIMRWLWALGIPFGIDQEALRSLHETGLWLAGAALASIGACGGLLTLGLIKRWGEIFPRWMIGLSGKPVPLALAIVPASIVAVFITTCGLTVIHMHAKNGFGLLLDPMAWWPIWGIALGTGTLAYYYRRRGKCTSCEKS